jgi:hypothetical protein
MRGGTREGGEGGEALTTTQVGAMAQTYAMVVSRANSCKNRLLKYCRSSKESLQLYNTRTIGNTAVSF